MGAINNVFFHEKAHVESLGVKWSRFPLKERAAAADPCRAPRGWPEGPSSPLAAAWSTRSCRSSASPRPLSYFKERKKEWVGQEWVNTFAPRLFSVQSNHLWSQAAVLNWWLKTHRGSQSHLDWVAALRAAPFLKTWFFNIRIFIEKKCLRSGHGIKWTSICFIIFMWNKFWLRLQAKEKNVGRENLPESLWLDLMTNSTSSFHLQLDRLKI